MTEFYRVWLYADKNNAVLRWNLENCSLAQTVFEMANSIRSVRYWEGSEATARLLHCSDVGPVFVYMHLNADKT